MNCACCNVDGLQPSPCEMEKRVAELELALVRCAEWVDKSDCVDDARGHVHHFVEDVLGKAVPMNESRFRVGDQVRVGLKAVWECIEAGPLGLVLIHPATNVRHSFAQNDAGLSLVSRKPSPSVSETVEQELSKRTGVSFGKGQGNEGELAQRASEAMIDDDVAVLTVDAAHRKIMEQRRYIDLLVRVGKQRPESARQPDFDAAVQRIVKGCFDYLEEVAECPFCEYGHVDGGESPLHDEGCLLAGFELTKDVEALIAYVATPTGSTTDGE